VDDLFGNAVTAPETEEAPQEPINPPRFVPINAEPIQEEVPSAAAAPSTDSESQALEPAYSAPQQPDPTQAKLQQYEQAFSELQRLAAQAEQQRQEQQVAETFRSRRDQIYENARNLALSPEDQMAYIRRHEDQEMAILQGAVGQIRQQAEQEKFRAVAAVAAPQYAAHLASQHRLPAEYAQRLAMLPPQQMDSYVPVLVQEYQQRAQQEQRYNEVLTQLDQLRRSQQAGVMVASGAHTVTNATPTPASNGHYQVEAGSREHLLGSDPRLAAMFGYKLAE
jgi:hypothetical protein